MHKIKTRKQGAESGATRPIGMRMPEHEYLECQALAQQEDRSLSNFALMIYRQGLAAYKKQRGIQHA